MYGKNNLRGKTKQTSWSRDKLPTQLRVQGKDTELRRRMDEHSENFNKELQNIKNQTDLKNIITKIKKYTRRNQQ